MRMKSTSAELIVGSSQEIDDDLSDVEEVFIRNGRGGSTREVENKPLMPLRKKQQHKNSKSQQQLKALKNQYKRSRSRRHRCCEPFCYAILVILVIIILAAIVLTLFPTEKLKLLFQNASPRLYKALIVSNVVSDDGQPPNQPVKLIEKVPCQNFNVSIVWNRTFSKLNSEAPLRKADLDGDGIEDIIIGFGIDDSTSFDISNNLPQCTFANGQVDICEGGIMALNGVTGDALWKYWSPYAIFSHFCKFDVNNDEINDCIIAGPGGLLQAIDGKSGKLLWDFKRITVQTPDELDINAVNLYTVNLIRDLDLDGIPDIVASHTSERFGIREGHILLISGKNGKTIRSISSPYKEEIFLPIQFMTMKDGTEYLLVLTGGQNTAGGIYKIRVDTFKNFKDDSDYMTIHRSSTGFLVPAILTDLNNDGIDDIVVASFNSTIYAFNGGTNNVLWTFSFPSSETVSDIVPGLFNNDNVADFMIKYSTGPGFPIYYYSQTSILDGTTGKALLDSAITDSGGSHSLLGGISISLPHKSGDFFLHFQSRCKDKLDAKDPYKFVPNSDIIQQSRADTCMLRYNTSTVLMLNAINQCLEPPGNLIFSSDNIPLEFQSDAKTQNTVNVRQPQKHPKMRIKVPQNRIFQPQPPIEINKKQSNMNEQFIRLQQKQQEKQTETNLDQLVIPESQKKKTLKFREKQLAEDLTSRRLKFKDNQMSGFEDTENNENINDLMSKISMMELPRELKDELINDDKAPDYDMYYDQSQQRRKMQSSRRGPNNRGIRSDLDYETPSTYETILHELEKNHKKQDSNSQTVKKVLDDSEVRKSSPSLTEPRAETLWDIEIEKENRESHKNEIRKREAQINKNILPSISSTGVLLNSLKSKQNSIDFVFTINVRASEAFPPILTQTDIQCIEDKMAALDGSYQDDVINWRDTFLKECIEKRISYLDERPLDDTNYETQTTVVRLSISCECGQLNEKNEICSSFLDIKQQKWAEHMGTQLDGTFNKS